MADARTFTDRLRRREPVIGYWITLDSPASTERVARLGYDYVCIDMQHGLIGYDGMVHALTAIDAAGADLSPREATEAADLSPREATEAADLSPREATGGRSVGLVRVGANDPALIGRALDAGAAGVIVPLVNSADDAARALAAAIYPPKGIRSYGPLRSGLRIGPKPADADASVACVAMIETPAGLADIERICAVPGLTGVYIGPSDLTLAVGGAFPGDPAVAAEFEAALARINKAGADAGIAVGIHTPSGADTARRLAEGFTFASVSSDLAHLELAAAEHLRVARG